MPAPKISLAVEPSDSGTVFYLPLAATSASAEPTALLALYLLMMGHEPAGFALTQVTLSFSSPPSVGDVTYPVSLSLPDNTYRAWWFEVDDNVILPFPCPKSMSIDLYAEGYDVPAHFSFPLAPYTVTNGGYLFPSPITGTGEVWQGAAGLHAAGSEGSQLFGHDLDVRGFDATTSTWTGLRPGTSDDANESFRVWGKQVRAIADGTVLEVVNDVPGNPHPLHWTSEEDLIQQAAEQQLLYWGTYPNGGAGNHFYIQHGEIVVLYAHMQKGTLNPALLNPGAIVHAGAALGLAGNSGNSSAPHLHVHAVKGTVPESGPLRPMPFRDVLALDLDELSIPLGDAAWATVEAQGLPHDRSAIWQRPVRRAPTPHVYEATIDPLALLLRSDIYLRLTLPDPGPDDPIARQVREAIKRLSPSERRSALARLKAFRSYLKALERDLREE